MALKDVLQKQTKSKPTSWLDEMEAKLSQDDFNYLMACIKDTENFSGAYIAQSLTKAGYGVSITTINKIRKSL